MSRSPDRRDRRDITDEEMAIWSFIVYNAPPSRSNSIPSDDDVKRVVAQFKASHMQPHFKPPPDPNFEALTDKYKNNKG